MRTESVTQGSQTPEKGRRLRGVLSVSIVAVGASLMLLACSTRTISSDRPGSGSVDAVSRSQIASTQSTEANREETATAPTQTETLPTETVASKDGPQSAPSETAAAEAASKPKKPDGAYTEPTVSSQTEKPVHVQAETDEDIPGDNLTEDPKDNPTRPVDSDEDLNDNEP